MPRFDGRRLRSLDGFTQMLPFIMPLRYDATNYLTTPVDYERVEPYLTRRKAEGDNVSLMSIIIAAYVRTAATYPSINRFIMGKKMYARRGIYVSFITLKSNWDGQGEQPETVVKLQFKGDETLQQITDQVMQAIDVNRRPESENSADSIVKAIMSVPLLPSAIVSLIKGLDRIGLLPGAIIDASPFHTSLFFTNMASLRTAPVFHHLYAFGTTGTFIALGMTPGERRSFTLNISTDERIASGSTLARAFRFLSHLITHPERLEVPPTEVVSDVR